MMEEPGNAVATAGEVAGCTIIEELADSKGYLGQLDGGRRVVLKVLDADCVQDLRLHPLIKDRLNRVRELATPMVANLRAVERDEDRVFLVWDYVEGQTLEEWHATDPSEEQRRSVGRDLIQAVESMHLRGIVHGALHGGNVIVSTNLAVRLTHVSPLLYNDPREDVKDVIALLDDLMKSAGFGVLDSQELSLRDLAARFAALGHEEVVESPVAAIEDKRLKRQALWVAIAAVVLAVVIYGAMRKVGHRTTASAGGLSLQGIHL